MRFAPLLRTSSIAGWVELRPHSVHQPGCECYNGYVPRRREHSRYQLPLEFGVPNTEDTAVYQALLHSLSAEATDSRFVRAVREEVVVRSPADVAQHLMTRVFTPFEHLDQEELWLLLLSTRNRITHEVMLYRGTLDTIQVRPAEVFKEAIRVNAAAIVLAHNHPSSDPEPSPQDVKLTTTIMQLGKVLGVPLLDHLVVGDKAWISLKERNLGFNAEP